MNLFRLATVLVALLLSACTAAPPAPTGPAPLTLINLRTTGGTPGVSRTLHITTDGTLLLRNEQSGDEKRLHVEREQLREMMHLVSLLPKEAPVRKESCGGCRRYEIEFRRGGQMERQAVTQPAADSPHGELVTKLGELADDSL